jgi:membrane-bound lytic murein transglycosylase D
VPEGSREQALAKIADMPVWKPPQEVYGTHVVRKGESLYIIARRYRTSVTQLKKLNGLRSNLIRPGQKLRVRGGVGGITVDGKYQVRRGDTLGRIAQAHGVSLTALVNANGLSTRSTIYPGQWLAIPD